MQFIEIYRSRGLLACQHRAFVLHAVGIESQIVDLPEEFALCVADYTADTAREHLRRYEEESAHVDPPLKAPTLHPYAWLTPLLFTVTLLAVGYWAGRAAFGFEWYDAGALLPRIERNHQWWRALTALTLHADHPHLLGNLGFGVVFSYMAARLMGAGVAWFAIIFAATLGNVLDSLWMPATHVSMGASTAVFATLGLVSAFSWRLQFSRRLRWAHRWAPLVSGVVLLGLIGSGGENTDVLAHLTGFFCGCLFGVGYARMSPAKLENKYLQLSLGVVACGLILVAWSWAGLATALAK